MAEPLEHRNYCWRLWGVWGRLHFDRHTASATHYSIPTGARGLDLARMSPYGVVSRDSDLCVDTSALPNGLVIWNWQRSAVAAVYRHSQRLGHGDIRHNREFE